MTRADRELFDRAFFFQKNNRIQPAIKVWKQFLQKHPRSFEAHNNLGLVYFEDDQVGPSIAEFETALSLEPSDAKIKRNLIRVLAFKATLLKEARDYNGAVDTMKRAQEISIPEEKERIGFIIEKYEDKVFEQTKQADTLEAYEGFLKRFPNSAKNADEARMKIEGLKPRSPEVGETAMDDQQKEEPSSTASPSEKEIQESDSPPETSMVKSDPGNMESSDKDRTDKEVSMMKGIIPEQPQEAMRSAERPIEIATQPDPKPSTAANIISTLDQLETDTPKPEVALLEPKVNVPSSDNISVKSKATERMVEIVTRKDPLRVRDGPFLGARILATVAKGSQVPIITERDGWYKVEFSVGQMGWISKKYAKLVE